MSSRCFLVSVLAVLAWGCASSLETGDRPTVSTSALLEGAPLGGTHGAPAPVDTEDVLALSPEMLDFVNTNVNSNAGHFVRLRQLGDSIIDKDTFGVTYDEKTRTAAETFDSGRGNCLSFSSMFVVLGRAIGLKVRFQEVEIPPDWSLRNDAFVLNRHVNVHIDLGDHNEHVVDFNIDDFRSSYEQYVISDARALAHYYNNMGVEHMQAGETASALLNFRKAIEENDSRFSPAWTNLGTLYMRNDQLEHAEAAYLEALRVDDRDLVAMSNLVRLYERQGDSERAAAYQKRVLNHRNRNPYYRFQLARVAYSTGDYDEAIGHLMYAVRKRKTEDRFYSLLGLCYLQKGDKRAARRWLLRAEEVAATDAQKRRYMDKMDILLPDPE